MKKTHYLALLLGAALPAALNAQILVQYNFNTNNNTTAFNATTVEAGVSATAVTEVGFASVSSANDVAFSVRQRAVTLNQIDNSFATDHYYQFTLTPGVGESLDLTSLSFYFNISAVDAAANSRYQLRYDNLADGGGFVTLGTTVYATSNTSPGILASFDLSGASFNNLAQGITFRLDVEDSGSNDSGRSVRLDLLTVNGAVIPEPGSSALILGGGVVLLGLRRARMRA